jgi:hypothetical protein
MADELAKADKTPVYERYITEQTIATAARLMKDWTTALIQLETAALGVIGALVSYADFSKFALPLGFEEDRSGRSVKPMRGIR